ncbi:MAG: ABC transporter substrate-binding protein [Peptococcaceae bacterium]|nr:ABC transporter substrate-binding protein [Peptococcaceae bacterium]
MAGCGSEETTTSEEAAAQPIKLGLLPITDNLPFWVAEQKGYFTEEGVEVELVNFKSAVNRDSALTADQVDGVLGDIISVAQLNDAGTPVKIVSIGQGVTAKEGRFAILSSPQSNITDVEQLKGVGIGCSLKTIMEYIIDQTLTAKGFSEEDIKKVQIPQIPLRLEALLNGSLEAAILPDPLAALAEIKGAHVVLEDTDQNISQTVIYFREETLNENLAGVRAVMRAYARAVQDIQANPDAFTDLLIEKARMPEIVAQSDKHGMEIIFSAPELPTEEQVNRVLNWMKAKNLLKKDLACEDLIDKRVLNN